MKHHFLISSKSRPSVFDNPKIQQIIHENDFYLVAYPGMQLYNLACVMGVDTSDEYGRMLDRRALAKRIRYKYGNKNDLL